MKPLNAVGRDAARGLNERMDGVWGMMRSIIILARITDAFPFQPFLTVPRALEEL